MKTFLIFTNRDRLHHYFLFFSTGPMFALLLDSKAAFSLALQNLCRCLGKG